MASIDRITSNEWTLLGRGPMRVSGRGYFVRSLQYPAYNAPMLLTTFGQDFNLVGTENVWARSATSAPSPVISTPIIPRSGEVMTSYSVSGRAISGIVTSKYGPEFDIAVRIYANRSTVPVVALADSSGAWSATAEAAIDTFSIQIDATKASDPPIIIGDAGLLLNLAMHAGVIGPAWM